MEVAAWREREAQERDVPRGRVLKDDAIGDIAVQAPTTSSGSGSLRSLPRGFERSKWGEAIVAAVAARACARSQDAAADRATKAAGQWPGDGGTPEGAAAHDGGAAWRGGQGHCTVDDLERIAGETMPTCRRCMAGGANYSATRHSHSSRADSRLSIEDGRVVVREWRSGPA